MEEILYEVWVELDNHNCITGVEGTSFHSKEKLEKQGYIKIDEGSDWSTYCHCQSNYLKNKYGKPTYDEQFKPNFKYENNKVVELTVKEKETFFPSIQPQPTFEEQQTDFNIDTDYRLSMLELGIK